MIILQAICPKIKSEKKKGSFINPKKPKLDNLHRDDKEMGPPVDQLLFKLNRDGSNSLEIFRGKY